MKAINWKMSIFATCLYLYKTNADDKRQKYDDEGGTFKNDSFSMACRHGVVCSLYGIVAASFTIWNPQYANCYSMAGIMDAPIFVFEEKNML